MNTPTNTPEEQWENVLYIEFEKLYTGFHEIKEFSQLQDKLKIEKGSIHRRIPLFEPLWFYVKDDSDPCFNASKNTHNKFIYLFPDIARETEMYSGYYPCSHLKWNLFTIRKCFENSDRYLFYSDVWCIYTVLKQDFINNWPMASSLRLLSFDKWPLDWKVADLDCDKWEIKYYLKWYQNWTIDWSCFTYVNKSDTVDVVYIWNKSHIYRTKFSIKKDSFTNKEFLSHQDDQRIDLELWEIKEIALDSKKNLLFIICENEEWKSDLHILDHKKLFKDWEAEIERIKTIEWISDVKVLPDWSIILSKSDWTTDILNSNINTLNNPEWWSSFKIKKYEVKKGINSTKKQVLESLWWTAITLDDTEVSNKWNEEDTKIIEWIRERPIQYNWMSKTLKEWFNEASSEEEIDRVKNAFLQIIKANENLNSVPDLLKQISKKINDKQNKIVLNSIYSELWNITDELWQAPDLATLYTIKDKLKIIQKKRGNIQAWIVSQDKELKNLLEITNQKINEYKESHKEELENEVQENLEKIKDILDNIENAIDITSIYATPLYQTTEYIISCLDKSWQDNYKGKLKALIKKRLWELKEISDKAKKEELEIIESKKKEVEESLIQLKQILDEIDDVDKIEQLKEEDFLVKKIKNLLSELPNSEAQLFDLRLEKIFNERIFNLRLHWEELKWVVQNLDDYWIDTILYYDEDWTEKVERKIEWKERPDWKISLIVKLMNWETHEYDKSLYLKDFEKYWNIPVKDRGVKFDMDTEEFAQYSKALSKRKNLSTEEKRKLKDKTKGIKDNIETLENEINDKQQKLKKSEESHQKLESEIANKQQELKELEESLRTLKNEIANKQQGLKELEELHLTLKNEIANKQQELKELEELHLTLESEIANKQQKLKNLKESYKKMENDYIKPRYTEILINRLIRQLKLNPRWKLPEYNPNFIVLDEEKKILTKLSARLVDQKKNCGIEILEWWPGLWKTVMCEFLAQVTNREYVRVQCSKMDPSDMFFSPNIKKWETTREPADWIQLMQKPGTIVLFDEIDKLNDQCFERLHSLFDTGRSIYDPQLWKVKANRDCLFLGTRNSYDRLSNPIISRWRILRISYPGEKNESYKISKYANNPVLRKLSYEEFLALYDKYIIRGEPQPKNTQERNIYDLIKNIKHLLNIFTQLRETYKSDDPLAYELSYRDARQIFVDYNWWMSFKEALESVLIPKARAAVVDPDEKDAQEDMVKWAIDTEM